MKRYYKLIKLYPGSSPLGSLVVSKKAVKGYYYVETKNSLVTLSREEVELFPEFWESYK